MQISIDNRARFSFSILCLLLVLDIGLTQAWASHEANERSDGTVAFDFWDAYHLIRIEDRWKILGDTVYEEQTIVPQVEIK